MEASRWRHYFNDAELNALSRLLGWEMRFLLNREVAYHPGFAHLVNLYPLLHGGEELILSYAHDERSACTSNPPAGGRCGPRANGAGNSPGG